MAALAVDVAIVLLTTGAIWIGSGWLEDASERLASYYGLPEVVQGSIVTAIGSSFPELATVVIAAITVNSLELGVGAIVGSAVFNILVIPALAGITIAEDVEANQALVYKEALFYMLSVSILVITFSLGVIYYPVDGTPYLAGDITRPLALIPLCMYGLYIFIQYQDTADYDSGDSGRDIELGRQWGFLLASLVVILIAVERLVHSVDVIGTAFGIPEFIMGVTVAAVATSLPDAMVSVRAAREQRGIAAVANVLGSNTFDLLVAIPVGVLLVGSAPINFSMAIPMFGVLTLATILLFTALRTDMSLSVLEAYGLLAAYVLFVAWVVLETIDVAVDLLPT
ncbi:MAG: sodium:calcium antiporter [Halapricum sp.]